MLCISAGCLLCASVYAAEKKDAPVVSSTAEALEKSVEKSLKSTVAENVRLNTANEALTKQVTDMEKYAQAVTTVNNNMKSEIEGLRQQSVQLLAANQKALQLEDKIKEMEKGQRVMLGKIKDVTLVQERVVTENRAIRRRLARNVIERENLAYRARILKLQDALKTDVSEIARVLKEKEMFLRESGVLHYNLGVRFFHIKDYKSAVAEFRRAVEIDPLNSDAFYNLGIIYDNYLQDDPQAISCYQQYLKVMAQLMGPESGDYRKLKDKVAAKLIQVQLRNKTKISSPIDDTLRE